jgi:hypothetical protein
MMNISVGIARGSHVGYKLFGIERLLLLGPPGLQRITRERERTALACSCFEMTKTEFNDISN